MKSKDERPASILPPTIKKTVRRCPLPLEDDLPSGSDEILPPRKYVSIPSVRKWRAEKRERQMTKSKAERWIENGVIACAIIAWAFWHLSQPEKRIDPLITPLEAAKFQALGQSTLGFPGTNSPFRTEKPIQLDHSIDNPFAPSTSPNPLIELYGTPTYCNPFDLPVQTNGKTAGSEQKSGRVPCTDPSETPPARSEWLRSLSDKKI
jgi:hypothetical protein